MAADSLEKVLTAWGASADLHSPNPGASPRGIERAQDDIGRPLPDEAVDLYRELDGGSLLHGNLNLLPLLPEGVTLAVTTSSDLLRSWDWSIPDELLIIGDDGNGDQIGIWLPTSRDARPLIVQVGEIYGDDRNLAIVGDDLASFLLARTAHCLRLLADELETGDALTALDLPEHLQGLGDSDDDLFELLAWASPRASRSATRPVRARAHGLGGRLARAGRLTATPVSGAPPDRRAGTAPTRRGWWQAARWPPTCATSGGSSIGADLGRVAAARVEATAARRVDRARHVAGQHDALARPLEHRVGHGHGREQRLGVGVDRPAVQLLGRRELDDLAEVHDRDAVGDVAHDPEVVRDEHVGERGTRPAGRRAGSRPAPGSTRRAPRPARRRRSGAAAARARGRCRCAGAARPRTRAGSGCSARARARPSPSGPARAGARRRARCPWPSRGQPMIEPTRLRGLSDA